MHRKFSLFDEDESYKAFPLFNISLWRQLTKTQLIVEEDGKTFEALADCFEKFCLVKSLISKKQKRSGKR